MTLQITLVTDGSSDKALMPVLRWLFGQVTPEPIELRWGDLRGLPRPSTTLGDRLTCAVNLYPCQLLLVHRDAEKQPAQLRYDEVRAANQTQLPHACVVPVRMQEAWLLLDELALREAAGRPSGTDPLNLPAPWQWESTPDPKQVLHQALVTASGARGRRAKQFQPARAAHRLAELVRDWSPLRRLSAFQRLERDVRDVLAELGKPLHP